ncbi:MAG TPA: bifunctional 5,10-methylene-tetrahydrofolate dehydrogenase/5,10-methylene-tetrahydrofolate cyclohydrolase [Firmicutes bacterium]|nr:bifunctional 5,10-methylene-tetrahydrofolate dehydrogenase/5,10-methylene-tetrahydrofolate cyclohydrolase [Bacillota bacterium]
MPVIKGAQVVEAMGGRITKQVEELKNAGVEPCLAILRVGEDGSQMAYERGARNRLAKYGIKCETTALDIDVSQEDFEKAFRGLNEDPAVHGILILQPLPKSLSIESIKNEINPLKDVDAISPMTLYRVFAWDKQAFAPCTAEGVIEILDSIGTQYRGKKCVIVGCSLVVGRPLGMLLLARDATVTYCHEFTVDVPKEARDADILISAAGVPKLIGAGHVNENMTVVDVGINVGADGKMCGDVDFDAVKDIVANITPVPGGAGSVTTSVLADHVVRAAKALTK